MRTYGKLDWLLRIICNLFIWWDCLVTGHDPCQLYIDGELYEECQKCGKQERVDNP